MVYRWVPWHCSYTLPEVHQQVASGAGGQAVARPRAARVVAYRGRRVMSVGEEDSDAAKAS
jgi:hypothetical protein